MIIKIYAKLKIRFCSTIISIDRDDVIDRQPDHVITISRATTP